MVLELSINQTISSILSLDGKFNPILTMSPALQRNKGLMYRVKQEQMFRFTGHGLLMLSGLTAQLVNQDGTQQSSTGQCLKRTHRILEN